MYKIFLAAADLSAITADQFLCAPMPRHAAGAWIERRHGAPKNSRNFAGCIERTRVPVTLKLYPKLSHADTVAALTTLLRGRAPTLADITAFVGRS